MALPVLLLAPIAGFIGSIAGKLLDGLITIFTKKFLIHAALIAFFVSFYAIFMSAITAAMATVSWGQVPQVLQTGFSVLPTNTDDCIAIILAAKLAVLGFKISQQVLNVRTA